MTDEIDPPKETPAERKRRLARERQRRCRERREKGDRVLVVPSSIADEIADDEDFEDVALEILRRHVAR